MGSGLSHEKGEYRSNHSAVQLCKRADLKGHRAGSWISEIYKKVRIFPTRNEQK